MTITKRHKKRFLYPAGIISLILLPALCIGFLYKHKSFDITSAIEINWWSEGSSKRTMDMYGFKVHPDINFIEINLTGKDKDDKMKLDLAQLEIRQIITTKDAINGVHFHFNDDAKYWTLIRALDICEIENVKCYIPNDNDIWVFNPVIRPETKRKDTNIVENRSFCGNPSLMCDVISQKSQEQIENEKREKNNYIIGIVKRFWLSGVLFIAMTTLTIIKLRGTLRRYP